MAKLTKSTVFTSAEPKKETPLDKTARIVKEIQDGEAEQRRTKTARLRNARLDSEADMPAKTTTEKSAKSRKKPRVKAVV